MLSKHCPPPTRHRGAEDVTWARLSYPPGFVASRRRTRSRTFLAGLAFEKQVRLSLAAAFPTQLIPSPWFTFRTADAPTRLRWCQPDALLLDIRRSRITIVEVKLRHTADAWWQLRRLYEPVVRAAFGAAWGCSACEVVKYFDPATAFPEAFEFVDDLGTIHPAQFAVHIWNGELT